MTAPYPRSVEARCVSCGSSLVGDQPAESALCAHCIDGWQGRSSEPPAPLKGRPAGTGVWVGGSDGFWVGPTTVISGGR